MNEPKLPRAPDKPTLPSSDDDYGPPPATIRFSVLPGGRSSAGPNAAERVVEVERSVEEQDSHSRAERIRRSTTNGGLGELPPTSTWRDPTKDWECVKSDDPFEVLYLDYRQAANITPEMLEANHKLIRDFWTEKEANWSRGTARERIEREFGPDVRKHVKRISEVYTLLSAEGGLTTQAGKRHAIRRAKGEQTLGAYAKHSLADGGVTRDDMAMLFDDGMRDGLTEDEVANFLNRLLVERGFTPSALPAGESLAARLRSVDWMTAQRAASGVKPLKFGPGAAAHNVAELIDLCDQFPKEAEEYLLNGYIEPWLATSLNDAGLAKLANDARRSRERSTALELFVRELSSRAERPSVPVVRAEEPSYTLGQLPLGAEKSFSIPLLREQRRVSWGTVQIEGSLPGLAVPTTFAPSQEKISFKLQTVTLKPGAYSGRIAIEPAGGRAAYFALKYTVLPLQLTADPPEVLFGRIPFGQSRGQTIRLTASPAGGKLTGSVTLSQPQQGIGLAGLITSDMGQAELTVNTSVMRAARGYSATVRFDTNAGVIDVPIRFDVKILGLVVARWSLGLALLGAGVMWGLRSLFGKIDSFAQWTFVFDWAPPGRPVSLLVACGTIALVTYLSRAFVWTLFGRGRRAPKKD